jgi:hypothetical protein
VYFLSFRKVAGEPDVLFAVCDVCRDIDAVVCHSNLPIPQDAVVCHSNLPIPQAAVLLLQDFGSSHELRFRRMVRP